MTRDELVKINEIIRLHILRLEGVEIKVRLLEAENGAERELKEILEDYISTYLSALLTCSDFLLDSGVAIEQNNLGYFLQISDKVVGGRYN